jgi:hypothetical protein
VLHVISLVWVPPPSFVLVFFSQSWKCLQNSSQLNPEGGVLVCPCPCSRFCPPTQYVFGLCRKLIWSGWRGKQSWKVVSMWRQKQSWCSLFGSEGKQFPLLLLKR